MSTNAPYVLLIEDNPGDARYIQEQLREAAEFPDRSFDRETELIGDGAPQERMGGASPATTSGSDGTTTERDRGRQTGNVERSRAPTVVHESRLEAGLRRLESERPDVVLLDLHLPDSDGLDTLTTLLAHDETIPVVVLTGLRDRSIGTTALREGAEEYLVKDEINPDLLIRSIYHAIERRAHRHEMERYRALIEESTDANAIVDPDGTIQYITPSAERVLGYSAEELIGENAFEYVHPDDRERVQTEVGRLVDNPDRRPTAEFRFQHEDGSWIVLHARGRNLLSNPAIGGLVVYTRDISEQKERERQLEQQRERLAAVNELNRVVNRVTEAIIDRSTREEIEQIACEHLARSDAYQFAWVGERHPRARTVRPRASAATDGYLEEVTITTDPDDPSSRGPTGRAFETGEVQVVTDVRTDPNYERWREVAERYGFRSSAAVPIRHGNTTYGTLNVYAERANAFQQEERTVFRHLGEMIGHAIAAAERKQALLSDSVEELEFRIPDVFGSIDLERVPEEPITVDQIIPTGEQDFLVYGTVADAEMPILEDLVERIDTWERVTVVGDREDGVRFQLRVSDTLIMSQIASLGGSIERGVIEGTDLQLTVRLPRDGAVREVIEAIKDEYEQVEIVARRQITDRENATQRLRSVWQGELTDRQRTVLKTAYFAGFFQWPRETSGEGVAESLGISSPTFSEHLRAAQNKIFGGLLGDADDDSRRE